MADRGDPLHEVLDGYAKFLREKKLALDKHQPYLVRSVREFLFFARAHAGYSFEQTLERFLAEVGGRVGTKPWQLQQASDAIRIYRYQYRGAKAGTDGSPAAQTFVDDAARLERLREVIRLRHYASSTEKTYLHWNRRFLAYRHVAFEELRSGILRRRWPSKDAGRRVRRAAG